MSYEWGEFLTLAEALESNPELPGPREAALRSATSRAYYAAFHGAQELACRDGFDPGVAAGGSHQALQSYFRGWPRSEHQQIAKKLALELNRLHGHRIRADYEPSLGRTRPESLAAQALSMARTILDYLSCLQQ